MTRQYTIQTTEDGDVLLALTTEKLVTVHIEHYATADDVRSDLPGFDWVAVDAKNRDLVLSHGNVIYVYEVN